MSPLHTDRRDWRIMDNIRKYAKAWVALALAGILGAIQDGVLPEKYQPWGVVAAAVLVALGVRRVPNAKEQR